MDGAGGDGLEFCWLCDDVLLCVKSGSWDLEIRDIPLTCLAPHRSSNVLGCVALVLILLFFLLGCSPSPSSGKDRDALIDVLGPCSSSESGRNRGWCSLVEVVADEMGRFTAEGRIGHFLYGGWTETACASDRPRYEGVGDLLARNSSTSSGAAGDESLLLWDSK